MPKKIYLTLWMSCSAFWVWNALDRALNGGKSFLYACDGVLCDFLHVAKGWLFAPAIVLLPMLTIAFIIGSIKAGLWRRLELVMAVIAWVSFAYCASFFRS